MAIHTKHEAVQSRDGTEIGYVRLGNGPAIVFVHGAWADAAAWLPVAKLLAETFSCYVMDRRGRGRSGDGTDYTLDHEVEDIEAVLDASGPDASLLGHSSGAIYALEAARQVPVNRLLLYEPPLRWQGTRAESFLSRFREDLAAGRQEEAAAFFFREEARLGEEELSHLQSTLAWPQMAARAWICLREWEAILGAGLQAERYRDMSVPTLLLAGTETDGHPSFATHQLEQLLPDASVAMLDGQGHMAHRAVPDLVANAVHGFLDAPAPSNPAAP